VGAEQLDHGAGLGVLAAGHVDGHQVHGDAAEDLAVIPGEPGAATVGGGAQHAGQLGQRQRVARGLGEQAPARGGREVGCPVVRGNWDTWVLEGVPPLQLQAGPKLRDQGDWSGAQLTEPDKAFLRQLQSQLELDLGGTKVLCVHGSPRSVVEDIHATTSDEEVAQMFNGTRPAVLAAGHTHVQLARLHGSTLIVNPGSVGLPYETAPAAYWAMLGPDVELRRTDYDVEDAIARMRATDDPRVEVVVELMANPPRQDEVIEDAERRVFAG